MARSAHPASPPTGQAPPARLARARPRRTRPSLSLVDERGDSCAVWLPDPTQPLVLSHFGDASALAVACLDMPVEREVLVLLDERRAVTAMLFDPMPELGVGIGWCDAPGLEVPFTQTLDILLVDRIDARAPSPSVVRGFRALRRLHVLQGLLLLDVVLVDGDRVQSVAIGAGDDNDWFDPGAYDPPP